MQHNWTNLPSRGLYASAGLIWLTLAWPASAQGVGNTPASPPPAGSTPASPPRSPYVIPTQPLTPDAAAPLSPVPTAPPAYIPPNTIAPEIIAPPPTAAEAPYRLGTGDRLQVVIFRVPQYSTEAAEIEVDGTLNLPLVGKVSVNNLTVEEATAKLSDAYGQFLRRPIVTLNLLGRRPIQVGISGEVTRPGTYTLAAETAQPPTLTQILEAAGGLTQIADVRNVAVRRQGQTGQDEVIAVNLWNLLQTGDRRYDVAIRDGDSIFIPTGTINLAESQLLANTTFSGPTDQPINIAVVGEVFRPGAYTLRGGQAQTNQAGLPGDTAGGGQPTVTRAIQIAGGIRPEANVRNVQVRRLTRTGTEQVFEVNLWNLLQGDIRQDPILQSGDTIVIAKAPALSPAELQALAATNFSPDRIQVTVVGEVVSPGTIALPPNSSLNQAVLAAGGLNRRAEDDTVELVRLNADGTVSQSTIPFDLAANSTTDSNPTLRNNDVVIVERSGLTSITDALDSTLGVASDAISIFGLPFQFLRIFR